MNTIIYIIIAILSLIGIYHIFEEIVWQIHIDENPEDIEKMLDYMESKEKK